jgi:hypothetical protein
MSQLSSAPLRFAFAPENFFVSLWLRSSRRLDAVFHRGKPSTHGVRTIALYAGRVNDRNWDRLLLLVPENRMTKPEKVRIMRSAWACSCCHLRARRSG